MTCIRTRSAWLAAAFGALLLGASLAGAATTPQAPAPAGAATPAQEQRPATTNILHKIYTSGNARLARGDVKSAAAVFQTVVDIAPERPEADYSLGLAQLLADFAHREKAQPAISRALAIDPSNPLYTVAQVLSDPAASTLRDDGALYIAAEAATRLRAAGQRLAAAQGANNLRYAG